MFQLVSYCSKHYSSIEEAKAEHGLTYVNYDIDPDNITLRDFDNITDLLNLDDDWTKGYLLDTQNDAYYDIRHLYFIASVYQYSNTSISTLDKTRSVFMSAPGETIEMVCHYSTEVSSKYDEHSHSKTVLIPSNASYKDVLYMAQKLRNAYQNCNTNFLVGLRSNGSFISLEELKDYTLNGRAWVDATSAHMHTMNCISWDVYNEIFTYQ